MTSSLLIDSRWAIPYDEMRIILPLREWRRKVAGMGDGCVDVRTGGDQYTTLGCV
jgi:hypothetical protein